MLFWGIGFLLVLIFDFCFLLSETASQYAAQADLKVEILLPQPPECWYYKWPCFFSSPLHLHHWESFYIAQADFKLPCFRDPAVPASQVAGRTGASCSAVLGGTLKTQMPWSNPEHLDQNDKGR